MLPLSPHTACRLTGLVLLLRFSDASVLGSALRAHFSQLITELQSLCIQLLACLEKGEGWGVPCSWELWCLLGQLPPAEAAPTSAPLCEILAELSMCGASFPFCRDSFVLLTSYAGYRRPPVLPWQRFLLKYRWECKLILNKVKWRRGWIKLSKAFETTQIYLSN